MSEALGPQEGSVRPALDRVLLGQRLRALRRLLGAVTNRKHAIAQTGHQVRVVGLCATTHTHTHDQNEACDAMRVEGEGYREGGAQDRSVVFDGVHDGVIDNIVNLKMLIQRTGDEARAVSLLAIYTRGEFM